MASELQALQLQAHEAEEALRFQAERIDKDPTLSAEGKAQQRAKHEEVYRQAVRDLQSRAESHIESERMRLAQERRQAAERTVGHLLETLGPVVTADLYRRRIEHMAGEQIGQAYAAAVTDFERLLYREYGVLELEQRMQREPTGEDAQALSELYRAGQSDAVQQIEQALRELDGFKLSQLDLQAERLRLASTYGIKSELIQI